MLAESRRNVCLAEAGNGKRGVEANNGEFARATSQPKAGKAEYVPEDSHNTGVTSEVTTSERDRPREGHHTVFTKVAIVTCVLP